MSRLRFKVSMSLDGFVAGPSQSVDNPLGIGGTRRRRSARPRARANGRRTKGDAPQVRKALEDSAGVNGSELGNACADRCQVTAYAMLTAKGDTRDVST